jgi:Helix-turn-helix domain
LSVQAISWVLDYSRAKLADRLVLISIANHARKDGTGAWPSIQGIAEEAHVSRRQAQRSVRALIELGELAIEEGAGRRGTHVYRLPQMSPGQIVAPRHLVPERATNEASEGRSDVARTEVPNRPEPSEELPRETLGQRANRIARVYTDIEPVSRFPAIAAIVRTALRAGRTETAIAAALERLARAGRSVTVDSLRIEMDGRPRVVDDLDERLAEGRRLLHGAAS